MSLKGNPSVKINCLSWPCGKPSSSMDNNLLRGFEQKLLPQSGQVLCPVWVFKSHLVFLTLSLGGKGKCWFCPPSLFCHLEITHRSPGPSLGPLNLPLQERTTFARCAVPRTGFLLGSGLLWEKKETLTWIIILVYV